MTTRGPRASVISSLVPIETIDRAELLLTESDRAIEGDPELAILLVAVAGSTLDRLRLRLDAADTRQKLYERRIVSELRRRGGQ